VRMNYADALRIAKHFTESIEQYKAMTKLSPHDPRIHLDMGVCYFEMGDLDGAIKEFEEALRVAAPYDYPDARANLGHALELKQAELKNAQDAASKKQEEKQEASKTLTGTNAQTVITPPKK